MKSPQQIVDKMLKADAFSKWLGIEVINVSEGFSKLSMLVRDDMVNGLYDQTDVLSIFKNETMNLKLWLEHYLWQGVGHFYLIDNGSTDNPLSILQEYIDKGIITYFYFYYVIYYTIYAAKQ